MLANADCNYGGMNLCLANYNSCSVAAGNIAPKAANVWEHCFVVNIYPNVLLGVNMTTIW